MAGDIASGEAKASRINSLNRKLWCWGCGDVVGWGGRVSATFKEDPNMATARRDVYGVHPGRC